MKLSRLEYHHQLVEKAKTLPAMENRYRSMIARGVSSIVLEDGHHHVLVITSHESSQKIEAVLTAIEKAKGEGKSVPSSLLVPTLVGVDIELGSMMNPAKPAQAMNDLKKNLNLIASELPAKKNAVYRLPRMDGNLDTLKDKRYKYDTLFTIQDCLDESLKFLHDCGVTHNDIALRNLLFKGSYETGISIQLTDFGAASFKDDEPTDLKGNQKHELNCAKDLLDANRIVKDLKEYLDQKPTTPEKKPPSPPIGRSRRAATVGFFNQLQHIKNQDKALKDFEANFPPLSPKKKSARNRMQPKKIDFDKFS